MEKKTLDAVIEALEDYYLEYGRETSMEYTFGFFDALGVIREMKSAPVRIIGHSYAYTENASRANARM